jgi:hypothetical protein
MTLLKVLFLLGMPLASFLIVGAWMMHATGRDQFRSRAPAAVPLNFRLAGYDAKDAGAYWNWLGPDGRLAEQRFLEADMAFPFLYGGTLLASLLLAWAWLGRPINVAWLVAPVAITVIADWIENLVHWQQLKQFMQQAPVDAGWIQVATLATSVKLVLFCVPVLMLVALALWLPFKPGVSPS